jgi:3',5'-cyclic-AMP phosphodiesterase
MRIMAWGEESLARIVYMAASSAGGADTESLLVERAIVDELPADLDAIVATSDLQGIVTDWDAGGEPMLLGEHLADVLIDLAAQGLAAAPSRTGVVLAGDLYSAPDAAKRGASGDVSAVWEAFAHHFRWVVGVQGNHDLFGGAKERRRLLSVPNIHLLDGEVANVDGMSIGGVGLATGKPSKHGRRPAGEFLGLLGTVVVEQPQLVVLHEGPDGSRAQRGNGAIRDMLVDAMTPLTICGHKHWPEPTFEPQDGVQFVNVDKRAVVLQRSRDADARAR